MMSLLNVYIKTSDDRNCQQVNMSRFASISEEDLDTLDGQKDSKNFFYVLNFGSV